MTVAPEEYVALNQPEAESSTVSFIQDNYEYGKNKTIKVGVYVCGIIFLLVHATDLISAMVMLKGCKDDTYTPAYFIVAGLIGTLSKGGYIIMRQTERLPKIYAVFYPFYAFELAWLIIGTYYYALAYKDREGCAKSTYNLAYWLIIIKYISLKIALLVFCWCLSIIFSLVYFKNKIVQYIAKTMRF